MPTAYRHFMRTSLIFLLICLASALSADASSSPVLEITGDVKHELSLTIEDLKAYQSVGSQRNGVTTDHDFNGNFYFRGVPLSTLLDTAGIKKNGASFKKPIDMAVSVKTGDRRIALSWGEIFYRNPATVFIAYSATPILPHKNCASCHQAEKYEPVMAKYHRTLRFPKLILTQDKYSDRCLEGVKAIEVIQIPMDEHSETPELLFSEKFVIKGTAPSKNVFEKLDGLAAFHKQSESYTVGEGKGFHGFHTYGGYRLLDVLGQANLKADLNSVFLVTAPDNYRAVFSYGEIYLNPAGQRMMLAAQDDEKPLEEGGKYSLIVPDDLMADRCVQAVELIQKIRLE